MNLKVKIKNVLSSHDELSKLYLVVLMGIMFGFAFSKFTTSVAEFALLAIWFVSLNFKQKFSRLTDNKPTLVFMSILLVYILGLFYSSNLGWGMHSLKIKLPLLLFPLVLVSIKPFSKKQLKFLMYFFVAVIFAKTIQTLIYIIV